MGGNALKNCVVRRYLDKEYKQIDMDTRYSLRLLFPKSRVLSVLAYKNKENFGDLDILLCSENLPSDWVETVVKWFKPKEYVKNGNVLSFEHRQFQVDLIVTKPEELMTSYCYFAYNDLGNLLGRLANSIGLKLGHDGLSYIWKCDTYEFHKEVISTDWEEICKLLDVDYVVYQQGFDTLEDIFKFVVKSCFFHSETFLLENRNNYARTRDKKRKTYQEFLKYIEGCEHTNLQRVHQIARELSGKKVFLAYIFNNVKGFKETYTRVNAEWEKQTEFKKRFNGDLVKSWTGLDGKALGEFMLFMKGRPESPACNRDFVLRSDQNDIRKQVEYHYGRLMIMKANWPRQER
jgi:hypothetical protein